MLRGWGEREGAEILCLCGGFEISVRSEREGVKSGYRTKGLIMCVMIICVM